MTHYISIVRDHTSPPDGKEGRIFLDAKILGQTLERIGYMIPPGVYPVKAHLSPPEHFNRWMVQILIPGWSNILIHEGNVPPQSLGCVLTGAKDDPGAHISDSKPIVHYIESVVLPSLKRGDQWFCLVHEESDVNLA